MGTSYRFPQKGIICYMQGMRLDMKVPGEEDMETRWSGHRNWFSRMSWMNECPMRRQSRYMGYL